MFRPPKLGFDQHCFCAGYVSSLQYVYDGNIVLLSYVHDGAEMAIVKLFKLFHMASVEGPCRTTE